MVTKLKGYGIKGSQTTGVSNLIFKRKMEAIAFRKKVGGTVIKKTKIFR